MKHESRGEQPRSAVGGEPGAGTTYSIRAAERVCDILDLLQRTTDGVSLSEVADAARLPKSSAFRYLSVLEHRGYVERASLTGSYRLGAAFRLHDRHELERLIAQAVDPLTELRDLTGETTNLGTLDGASVVHHLVIESRNLVRLAARVGDRGAVHSTALGKALLAALPEERARALLAASPLERFTDRTITSVETLLSELRAVRQRGYAVDDCENQAEGRCLAVAVSTWAVPFAISVSAPASRLSRQDLPAVAATLQATAARLRERLAG